MSTKYTVQKGDTLGQIAKNNNTTVNDLVLRNNIKDPNKIKAGMTLDLSAAADNTKTTYSNKATNDAADNTGNTGNTNNAGNTGNGFQYDEFEYDDYTMSDTATQAYDLLQQHLQSKPGEYTNQWKEQTDDIISQILNREDFSYDINGDALYQQYKDQYTALGKLAMQDTMGQAAAMTGGYGSSYASSAGNQAYQQYLSKLNEVVPELYGMARDQYNQEGQELYNQYGLITDQENQDYGRYMDSYNQWASELDYYQGAYTDERNFDYNKYNNDRNFAYGQYSDDKSYAYNEHRNAIEDQQWQKQFDESVRQHNESLAESQRQFNEQIAFQKQQYEEAKAAGDGQAALEHVSSMSSKELVEAMQDYNYNEDDNGLAAFLDDCVASGRLTDEQADSYYAQYRVGTSNQVIDTTVPKGNGPNKLYK